MSYASDDVLDKQADMEATRALVEPQMRENARLFRPDDNDFQPNEQHNDRDDYDIFDATGLYALDNFVGGLFSQSVNPANRWFELAIEGDDDLTQWKPVATWLYRRANGLYGSLAPSVSGFYANALAWLANLGAHGFGPFWQEEAVGAERIVDSVVPIGEIYLDRDPDGNYDRVHRKFALSGRRFLQKFGSQYSATPYNVVDDDKRMYTVVQAVWFNRDMIPGRLDAAGKPWRAVYCSPDIKDFRLETPGYWELPCHIPTWQPRARSPYPTGPGHNAKADDLSLQEMERVELVAAQRQAEPILLAHSEDMVSAADLVPNNILYGAITDGGKKLIEELAHTGQLPMMLTKTEQKRQAIRTAFYFSMMQLIAQRPQMTATEFLGFKEEDLRLMAPHLVRVQTGGLSPFVARRYAILDRAGAFGDDPPPPELQGRRISLKYVSPLARLVAVSRAKGVLQYQGAIEQMAATDPQVRDWFNGDEAAPIVREGFTEVPNVVRDPTEVKALRKARAEMQARQQQLEQAGQAVSIAAEASHAQQASSLAQQRGRAA